MEGQNGSWTISKPFDTFLLKFWSKDHITKLEESLSGLLNSEIADAITPNRRRCEIYDNDILHETFLGFLKKTNLCDKFKFCQDVARHSTGLGCVTAAGIRKRLKDNFSSKLGTLHSCHFQEEVINHSKYVLQRKNLGVLIFDCPSDENANLRDHLMSVLFENFYLYTTPVIGNDINTRTNMDSVIEFIIKQIARNTDCIIIFVDQTIRERWYDKDDCLHNILQNTLCWDFKIRLVIISLCPRLDEIAIDIFKNYISLKPVVIMYHQLEMAPSGGLVALIEKSCRLNFKRAFLKYWFRGCEMCTICNTKQIKNNDYETHGLISPREVNTTN